MIIGRTGNGAATEPSASPTTPASPAVPASLGIRIPKRLWWVLGLLVLFAAAVASDYLAPSAPSPPAGADPSGKQPKPLSLSPQKTEHESWLVTAQGDLRSMREQMDLMTRKQDLLEQALKMQDRAPRPAAGAPAAPAANGLVLRSGDSGGALPEDAPPPMRTTSQAVAPAGAPPAAAPSAAPSAATGSAPPASAGSSGGPSVSAPPGPPTTGPLVAPVQAGKPAPAAGAAQKLRVIEADRQTIAAKYWLPTGAVLPVRLLSGLDAPTGATGGGTAGGSSPHPVLMEVTDWATLPNHTTLDAVGCFALGEGIGDISMERAMIRVLGISCVKSDGMAVDLPIKGVITGEDGKVGLRGRMVIRESAMLARALMTGFISGISKAFMPFQMGFMVAPGLNQALQLPDPERVGLAGMAGGMQQAASLLARHYSQMAARIYPVIEVDAGRWADLIVTEGRELTGALK